jgi:lysophospholipase L1-like esterase
MILLVLTVVLAVAAMPGIAFADDDGDDEGDDQEAVYLSLGDSLAMGSLADSRGETIFPSNKSYTDYLYRILQRRVDDDIEHVKLGCDGYKTTDMMADPGDGKCSYDEVTQLLEAVKWLQTGDVALVTISIGANDVNHLAATCGFDPVCIQTGIPGVVDGINSIFDNLQVILATLRSTGYTGPIVGTLYFNPFVAAEIGHFPGSAGPPPIPGLAPLSAGLAEAFNGGLAATYTHPAFGGHVADVYAAFKSGDFGDDGGRFQKKGNGIPDNADAVCRLTYMCPRGDTVEANQHPTPKGYRVMAAAFWKVVRTIDLGQDDDHDEDDD